MSDLHGAVLRAHEPDRLPLPYRHETGRYELSYELSDDRSSFVVRGGGGGDFLEPIDFGCTATVALLACDGGAAAHVIVGNLGDSPAVLARETDEAELICTELSERHAASEKAEQERVQALLGDSSVAQISRSVLRCVSGPLEGHALEPTRGLGHPVFSRATNGGFSQQPHIRLMDVRECVHDDACALIVMTDGVSDLLGRQALLQVLVDDAAEGAGPPSAQHTARQLVERAVAAVDGGAHDDAAAAVVLVRDALKLPKRPPAAAAVDADAQMAAVAAQAVAEAIAAAIGRLAAAPTVPALAAMHTIELGPSTRPARRSSKVRSQPSARGTSPRKAQSQSRGSARASSPRQGQPQARSQPSARASSPRPSSRPSSPRSQRCHSQSPSRSSQGQGHARPSSPRSRAQHAPRRAAAPAAQAPGA
eukprot:979861-Prymnesium_polylepis.1